MTVKIHGLVDVHAHICDISFDKDREIVLARAARAGVLAVVAVGENMADAIKNLDLAQRHSMVHAAAGLYPTYLDLKQANELIAFVRQNPMRWVAIGEVGLDFWAVKEETQKALQKAIFRQFILLANELQLPLNVHSRSAGRHAIAMLLENDARLVQLHAFDGKFGSALPAVEAGYFFSIPPSIIRSRQKQKLVKQLPLSCLLVESDSPVLGPERQSRNEPANITIALQEIARLKGLEESHVRAVVSANCKRLYGRLNR